MIIRHIKPEDVSAVMDLIRGLAEYEKDLDSVVNTTERLKSDIFEHNYCDSLVGEVDGNVVGFALYYTSYSTWKGPCLYLEDLFVLPEYRSIGLGSKLFDAIVNMAKSKGVARMDWQVLDWNQSAIEFYERKKATIDRDWLNGRIFLSKNE
ncbi:MAG: GNAT family N-acetyltransferase [Crocinitomicaceae bacterium]|nr:GNAT family N-acetyltransferase [Crocinitomicaceae bacterium]